jgi:hypothetical protein
LNPSLVTEFVMMAETLGSGWLDRLAWLRDEGRYRAGVLSAWLVIRGTGLDQTTESLMQCTQQILDTDAVRTVEDIRAM